ncbi:MAG: transcription-repair coupling factor [Bacteriovoracaceae bacterium]
MLRFETLKTKLNLWLSEVEKVGPHFSFSGINATSFEFFYKHFFAKEKVFGGFSQILLCPTAESAEDLYQSLKQAELKNLFYFPGLEISPYSSALGSEASLFRRLHVLSKLKNPEPKIVITSPEGWLMRLPPPERLSDFKLEIKTSDIISPLELAQKLTTLGYASGITVEEPGTFAKKGEIFDIYPTDSKPVRLHYFDDMIEEIYSIDTETQKTNREEKWESIVLAPAPLILTKSEFQTNLRSHLPQPQPRFKNRFEKRKNIFNQLSEGQLFEDYVAFYHLFFEENKSLLDFFDSKKTILYVLDRESIKRNVYDFKENLEKEFEFISQDTESDNLAPEPSEFFQFEALNKFSEFLSLDFNSLDIEADLEDKMKTKVYMGLETPATFFQRKLGANLVQNDKPHYIKKIADYLYQDFLKTGEITLVCRNTNAEEELKNLFSFQENYSLYSNRVTFLEDKLDQGFYYPSERHLVLSDADFFQIKKTKTKKLKTTNMDLFAEQLATLKLDDFVVHNQFGVGIYKGLESIEFGGNKADYLIIEYENRDKVYVPVYKMNLIQKYADSTASLKPANLQSKKFETAKNRARASAKTLAFDLLRLQAERKTHKSFVFSPPDHLFKEFELSFAFDETPDQEKAIQDVVNDLQRTFPMDRLVCGDVGFGKTEVAMRAAMKAVLDKKQVAILVPTTILALQHYNSFKNRFKDFAVNIEFISRFKSTSEVKVIQKDLEDGKIDIVIGTHALLSPQVKFFDLGLVIIDEEHRFGVGHKEQLKLMRSNVHCLVLTATPIPRTLQLSFMGIRDLSLIQTAPPKRQSIKTYIIHEDNLTIKNAIDKELSRGGQVYFVHNRVHDIEEVAARIKELVPKAKIAIGHGQMNERELEKTIKSFYQGEYDILLATTIIESGIDIPRANTMIIDRADTYGLAQLHQLRGRIGRSDKKAYAYLMVPAHRNLSELANKRLKALQTYAEIGSGFSIASSDLEIRGAGDILGADQSGHIEAIGLELYMELLNEAILELKGTKIRGKRDIEISTPELSLIPKNFITDSALRLKYYKRLSNCSSLEQLVPLREEILDMFGAFPKELSNLFLILECRLVLQYLGLLSVKVGGKNITLKFDQNYLESIPDYRNKVIELFMSRPKVYKISPDFSVTYEHKNAVSLNDLLDFSNSIAQSINPC